MPRPVACGSASHRGRGGILAAMTDTGDPAARGPPGRTRVRATPASPSADAVTEVCPYLVAGEARGGAPQPTRDHRCGAVEPAVVARARQAARAVPRSPRTSTCATYVAAQELARPIRADAPREAPATPASGPRRGRRCWSSSPSARLAGLSRSARRAGGGQALLVGLMVLAFLVLVIARTDAASGAADAGAWPAPRHRRRRRRRRRAPTASADADADAHAAGDRPGLAVRSASALAAASQRDAPPAGADADGRPRRRRRATRCGPATR